MRTSACLLSFVIRRSRFLGGATDTREVRGSSRRADNKCRMYTEGLRGSQRMRFDAQKSTEDHYWFLAYLSGMGNPEIHVTEPIIQSWKTQCGVSANVIFP